MASIATIRSLALEEVGQPYDVRLLTFSEMKESAYLCGEQVFLLEPALHDAHFLGTSATLRSVALTVRSWGKSGPKIRRDQSLLEG